MFVMPQFSLVALVGVALPLFIVTRWSCNDRYRMEGQAAPGEGRKPPPAAFTQI